MRTFFTLCALATLCGGLAVADTWSGKLMDATCYDKEKAAQPCHAASTTTAFAVDVNGKVYKLDGAGNAKAAAAIKNRADRSQDPGKPGEMITAKITGSVAGETIKVDTVELP